jgi:hypothetical protein
MYRPRAWKTLALIILAVMAGGATIDCDFTEDDCEFLCDED